VALYTPVKKTEDWVIEALGVNTALLFLLCDYLAKTQTEVSLKQINE